MSTLWTGCANGILRLLGCELHEDGEPAKEHGDNGVSDEQISLRDCAVVTSVLPGHNCLTAVLESIEYFPFSS